MQHHSIPTDPELTSNAVEQQYLDILQAVKSAVTIPVVVGSAPFSAIWPTWRSGFDQAGANGLVLFNRFYQPDINLDELEIQPNVLLGTPQALRLPLTRIGILYGRIRASLAATSGVHGPEDVVKLLMVGADVTMLCSTLLRHGIGQLEQIEEGVLEWMEKHEYESVQQMKGSMSQIRCPILQPSSARST